MIFLTILSIIGTILNIHKRKECFIIWTFINSAWAVYDYSIGAWEQGLLFTVYSGLAIYGWIKWTKSR